MTRLTRTAFVFVLLTCITTASWAGNAPDRRRVIKAWHREMVRRPLPKKGCFEAKYPGTKWTEVPCAAPPHHPLEPRDAASGHYTAQATGVITSSTGSFVSTSNVKSETDGGRSNIYSLQLNSNYFSSPSCSASSQCLGWQQFIYSSREQKVLIQYWLHDYGTQCPTGWTQHAHGNAPDSCWRNSDTALQVGQFAVTQLDDLILSGSAAAGGMDTLTFTTPDGTAHAFSEDDNVLGLGQSKDWKFAEFVVVGAGGGSEAVFNSGATIVMRTDIDDGGTTTPQCSPQVFTAETNNLHLVPPCCTYGGSPPGIVFTLSNAAGTKSNCSSSAAGN